MAKLTAQIIDAYDESKKLCSEELEFVRQLKKLGPGAAADSLVNRLVNDAKDYEAPEFIKHSIGMTMAYLEQCSQPEREWRYKMLQYTVCGVHETGLPQKIKDAFALIG